MAVLGLVINVLTVIVAGNAGVMFRGKLRTRYQEIIVLACGLVMGVAGLAGGLRSLFSLSDGKLEIAGSVLIVVSLIIGGMLGSSLNPEEGLDRLGRFFRRLTAPSESVAAKRKPVKANAVPAPEAVENAESADGGKKPRRRLEEMPVYNLPSARSGHRFVDGFVIATLFLCLNPFTLTAAQQAGLTGSPTLYYYVSVLDFIVIAALATVYGAGVSFAAAPLLATEGVTMLLYKLQNLYQTSNFGHSTTADPARQKAVNALLDGFWGTTFPTIQAQFCVIAGVILIALGLNLAFGKKYRVGNLAPAMLIPVLYYGVTLLVQLAV